MHRAFGADDRIAGRCLIRFFQLLTWLVLPLLAACASTAPGAPSPRAELVHRYAPPGPRDDPWGPLVRAASAEFAVPEPYIYAVMWAESRGCQWLNGHPMRSLAGEVGLMQIPPSIYELIRSRIDVGPDPYLPSDNIRAGAYSLSIMAAQFGLKDGLAAYQFGPTELARSRAAGQLPPAVTQDYERRVWADYLDREDRRKRGRRWTDPDHVVCTWAGH